MKDCYIALEPVVPDIEAYKKHVLSQEFQSWDFGGGQVFHNIAKLGDTPFSKFVEAFLPAHEEVVHFARKSPLGQQEPNYIHSDDAHCDLTAILFLSTNPSCGTILYEEDGITPSVTIHMKEGKAFIFSAATPHSRVLEENFGDGDDARLVEIIFLKERT